MIKRNLGVFSSQNALKKSPENQRIFSGNENRLYDKSRNQVKEILLNYGHNPIINPTPFNIQNPYLKKEYQKFLNQN